MTSPRERSFGGAKVYDVVPRASDQSDQGWAFSFTEKLFESDDPRFDAILILGATLNHYTGNMNNILSYLYSGFSKQVRAVNRFFIRSLVVTNSIPSFENLETFDYTGRNSTVGTVDNSQKAMPDLSSEGVLAELRLIQGYNMYDVPVWNGTAVIGSGVNNRSWTHILLSPRKYEYDWLEVNYPLSFYLQSINFESAKPAWVFWKITAGVRFFASAKANPKFSKGISFGGTPS